MVPPILKTMYLFPFCSNACLKVPFDPSSEILVTNKTLSTTEAYIQPTSPKAGNAYYTKSAQSSTAAQTTGATAQYTKQNAFPINLNTATADELTRISGIGEKRAASIIAYRESIGGYTSVDQIKNIRGIGDATYAKIAPYLTV